MKLFAATPRLLLLTSGLASCLLTTPTTMAATTTCKSLTSVESAFVSTMAMLANMTNSEISSSDIADMFKPIDAAYPALSKCVASINPLTVTTTVMASSGYASCNKTISSFAPNEELSDATIRDQLCPFYSDTIMPCILNVAVQTVVDTMANSDGCCDDLKTLIKTSFGSDLKPMATEVLNRLGSVACSVKSFTSSSDGKTTTESCGMSLLQGLFSSETNLLPLVQMPTAQVCSAMAGKTFTNTLGNQTQMEVKQRVEPVGICYEPVSAVISMIASYPMISTMTQTVTVNGASKQVALADLFTTDKCVTSESLLAWLMTDTSVVMTSLRSLDAAMASLGMSGGDAMMMGGGNSSGSHHEMNMNVTSMMMGTMAEYQKTMPSMCFHLASGQKCDYGTATTTTTFVTTSANPTITALAAPSMKATMANAVLVVMTTIALATATLTGSAMV